MCGYVQIVGGDLNSTSTYLIYSEGIITADPYNTPYNAQLSYQWKIGEKADGSDAVNIRGATCKNVMTKNVATKYSRIDK